MLTSQAFRHECLAAFTTRAGGGTFRIYTGTAPESTADAPTGTLLASLPIPATPFSAPASGSIAPLGIPWAGSASSTGFAGYARVYEDDGTTVLAQLTVGAAGGGGDATLSSLSLTSGDPCAVTGYTVNNRER